VAQHVCVVSHGSVRHSRTSWLPMSNVGQEFASDRRAAQFETLNAPTKVLVSVAKGRQCAFVRVSLADG
jgi:hypothetical protein